MLTGQITVVERACGARTMLIYTPKSPSSRAVVCRPAPGPRRQLGRCVALLHAIMTFWVMYTFSLSHSLSFIFHENWHEINDGAQKRRSTEPL